MLLTSALLLPLPWPWHWEDKASAGAGWVLTALRDIWRVVLAKKRMEEKLTPPPKPGTPGSLPCGTLGHTAVEAHVHLL